MYKKYKNWLRRGEGKEEGKIGWKRQYCAASLLNQIKWCKKHTHKAFPSLWISPWIICHHKCVWLRNIKLKWDKSAPRRAASNPQLISPVVAPHHCAPLFSMTMCQIWTFWKHFPYAIIGSLLSNRKTEKKKNGMLYTKGTENLHIYLSSLSMAYYTLCFVEI